MVLGSPKPEEIPLSWIQPGTAVLNCSHDFLSGKCVKIDTGPLIKIGLIGMRNVLLIQKSIFLKCWSLSTYENVGVRTFWVTPTETILSSEEKPRCGHSSCLFAVPCRRPASSRQIGHDLKQIISACVRSTRSSRFHSLLKGGRILSPKEISATSHHVKADENRVAERHGKCRPTLVFP